MFESIMKFFKRKGKKEEKKETANSRDTAKERLHLVLMQDRANVSADFLELMKQEIIEVIKKYIEIDEGAIDVRLTNKENEDGTNGAPALYANIPILNIKHDVGKNNKDSNEKIKSNNKETQKENQKGRQKEAKQEAKPDDKNNKAEEIVQENNSETDLKKENKTEQKEENKKQEDLKKEKKAYKKNDETKSVDEKKEVKSEKKEKE